MAGWCARTGRPVAEYLTLTKVQRAAFLSGARDSGSNGSALTGDAARNFLIQRAGGG